MQSNYPPQLKWDLAAIAGTPLFSAGLWRGIFAYQDGNIDGVLYNSLLMGAGGILTGIGLYMKNHAIQEENRKLSKKAGELEQRLKE